MSIGDETIIDGRVENRFRFKQFEVEHSRSSMKVGMDSIILGCWTDIPPGSRILDVGTGCGILALMCAQRSIDSEITAIDIDRASVEEAAGNFCRSPWTDRLECRLLDFNSINKKEYDLIISNPPYFCSGVTHPSNPREKARHEDTLSPASLLMHGAGLLSPSGRIAMIIPAEREDEIVERGEVVSLKPIRILRIRTRIGKKSKRSCILFSRHAGGEEEMESIEDMLIYNDAGGYSKEIMTLCKDFYLNF